MRASLHVSSSMDTAILHACRLLVLHTPSILCAQTCHHLSSLVSKTSHVCTAAAAQPRAAHLLPGVLHPRLPVPPRHPAALPGSRAQPQQPGRPRFHLPGILHPGEHHNRLPQRGLERGAGYMSITTFVPIGHIYTCPGSFTLKSSRLTSWPPMRYSTHITELDSTWACDRLPLHSGEHHDCLLQRVVQCSAGTLMMGY